MGLNVFSLESADAGAVVPWCVELSRHRQIEVRHLGPEASSSGVWRGDPFIVAGRRAEILSWLNTQDALTREVLSSCAYFWVLTDNVRLNHPLLPVDRVAVLDWNADEQQVVGSAMSTLQQFPRLAGLSNDTRHLRDEILRLSMELRGPSTPVLLLGESGSGKEEVAQSLVAMSALPAAPGLHCISGAWLNLDPAMALSELLGIESRIATQVSARAGLFETHAAGALFIDDFDTAPKVVQEQLLRITATEKGKAATYRRIGGVENLQTNIWLLFATNADVEKLLSEGNLRPDFLYRFEDRVLLLPPLRDRLADLPAIAYHIWTKLVREAQAQEKAAADQKQPKGATGKGGRRAAIEDRVLSWKSIREIYSRKLAWEGNIRELAALLRLVASMVRMPQHRVHATGVLIAQILARGVNSKQWFIRAARSGMLTDAPATKRESSVDEILKYDSGAPVGGLSPCQLAIKERLGEHWEQLQGIARINARRDVERILRYLCRYLLFAIRSGSIGVSEAVALTGLKEIQAGKHLKWLAREPVFLRSGQRGKTTSKLSYLPGSRFSAPEAARNPE